MRRDNTQVLSDILKEILKTQGLDEKVNEARLVKLWPEVVGLNIAAQTKTIYIRNRTLYLHIASPIVRNELLFIKEKIVEKLNAALETEAVRYIVIR